MQRVLKLRTHHRSSFHYIIIIESASKLRQLTNASGGGCGVAGAEVEAGAGVEAAAGMDTPMSVSDIKAASR